MACLASSCPLQHMQVDRLPPPTEDFPTSPDLYLVQCRSKPFPGSSPTLPIPKLVLSCVNRVYNCGKDQPSPKSTSFKSYFFLSPQSSASQNSFNSWLSISESRNGNLPRLQAVSIFWFHAKVQKPLQQKWPWRHRRVIHSGLSTIIQKVPCLSPCPSVHLYKRLMRSAVG